MSTTIRISEETRRRFASMSAATGRPMSQLVDDAAEALERRVFFSRLNARFDELHDDPDAWFEIQAERDGEASTLVDRSVG